MAKKKRQCQKKAAKNKKPIANFHMVDYVTKEQRTFTELEFNDMDALIFSWISYLVMPEKFLDRMNEGTLKLESFLSDEEALANTSRMFNPEKSTELFKTISTSRRFKDVIVTDYVEKENPSTQLQYGSVVFHIPGLDTLVLAFKGTNGTMNGWYEDLDMCFKFPIASQLEAKAQTDAIMAKYPDSKFIMTGHSKGGNISVYAGVTHPIEDHARILEVYSFDGPGFLGDFAKTPEYKDLRKRIHKFIPQTSVFGLLLEYSKHYKVIESDGFFVYQHSPFTWLVDLKRNKLKSYPELTKSAKLFSTIIDKWMNDFTIDEREHAIRLLFETIIKNGITTSKELKKNIPVVMKSMSKLDDKDKEFFKKVVKSLTASGFGTIGSQLKPKSNKKVKRKDSSKENKKTKSKAKFLLFGQSKIKQL